MTSETSNEAPIGLLGVVATSRFIHKTRKNLCYEPTYQLGPNKTPDMSAIYQIIKSTIDSRLSNFAYDGETARSLCMSMSDEITKSVNALDSVKDSRYRTIAFVTVGEKKGQTVEISSRCAWSSAIDNHVSYSLEEPSYFCVATVYVVYKE